VYESEGYDSESLALIATPPPTERESTSLPTGLGIAPAESPGSSQGFTVVGDTVLNSARDDWRPEVWPSEVRLLHAQFNPSRWKFPGVRDGFRGGLGCGCRARCTASTCLNARCGRFCTKVNCSFAATCGNALQESPALRISKNLRTGMRGITATQAIPAGEIIGEYFGHVQLFGPPCKNGPVNEGYRLHLKTRTTGKKYVGIDSLEAGRKLRMMNHSCNPAARFHEVQTGHYLTVVAVTIRDVFPGEEVTVSYGDCLWFVCRCGWWAASIATSSTGSTWMRRGERQEIGCQDFSLARYVSSCSVYM